MRQLGAPLGTVSGPRLGDWLAAGPFALAMSSGFFAFYAHTGILSGLLARGLTPHEVAGSSAGALVAGAWGSGIPLDHLSATLARLERRDFWDPALGLGLLAGHKFDRVLRALLPVADIAQCAVPVRISAFDIYARSTRVLAGDLASAIRASCALPGMFHPVWRGAPPRPYWDGGIADHPGIVGVTSARVLLHHIATGGRKPPRRPGLVSLVIAGLPRVTPFHLDRGPAALAVAARAMVAALDRPIVDGRVDVS